MQCVKSRISLSTLHGVDLECSIVVVVVVVARAVSSNICSRLSFAYLSWNLNQDLYRGTE